MEEATQADQLQRMVYPSAAVLLCILIVVSLLGGAVYSIIVYLT